MLGQLSTYLASSVENKKAAPVQRHDISSGLDPEQAGFGPFKDLDQDLSRIWIRTDPNLFVGSGSDPNKKQFFIFNPLKQ